MEMSHFVQNAFLYLLNLEHVLQKSKCILRLGSNAKEFWYIELFRDQIKQMKVLCKQLEGKHAWSLCRWDWESLLSYLNNCTDHNINHAYTKLCIYKINSFIATFNATTTYCMNFIRIRQWNSMWTVKSWWLNKHCINLQTPHQHNSPTQPHQRHPTNTTSQTPPHQHHHMQKHDSTNTNTQTTLHSQWSLRLSLWSYNRFVQQHTIRTCNIGMFTASSTRRSLLRKHN